MSRRNRRVTRQGFSLLLTGTLIQRCASAGLVGWGTAAGFEGEPGWAWWFAGAAACFILGTTLMSLAYRHTRHITPEE